MGAPPFFFFGGGGGLRRLPEVSRMSASCAGVEGLGV